MSQNVKNIAVVSLSTVGSRLLGLVRDALIFAALGASVWSSAFILAFTLPNLFRRLFGEGALSSALVPVFSDVLQREGRASALGFFNHVFLRLCGGLVLVVCLGMLLLSFAAKGGAVPERWALGAQLSVWMLPYMLLICLAAIVSVVLNVFGRFAIAASTPVILNLSMIAALGWGMSHTAAPSELVLWLCAGVLCGGILQLALPSFDLVRQGWRLQVSPGASHQALHELWRLFLPGLIGAAILQVNILVSRLLAYTLNDTAASVLYLASRLMELPLGVFTIAVATVFFPLMAKSLTAGNSQGFVESFESGLRLIVAIAVPAGVGLVVLAEPILSALFEWGAFDLTAVLQTVPLVAIYGFGLPFYSVATFATRGLHAGKDMVAPVQVAAICLIVNAVLGVVLMQFWAERGLALANVLAAAIQAFLLWRALAAQYPTLKAARLCPALLRVLLAAGVMGLVCALGLSLLGTFAFADKSQAWIVVICLVPMGVAVYFSVLYWLKFEELHALRNLLPGASMRR